MTDTVRSPIMLYAELGSGVVTGGDDPAKVGQLSHFITTIDADGGRTVVWDGASAEDAREALAEWQRDGVLTVDMRAL